MSAELEEDVFTGKFDFSLWRQLLPFALPYKHVFVRMAAIALSLTACEVAIPFFSGHIVGALKDGLPLRWWITGYLAFALALPIAVFFMIYHAGIISTNVSADIRRATFAKLQRLPFAFYDKRAVGWLMARLTGDCNSLSRIMAWGLVDMSWGLVTLLVTFVIMLFLNWKLGLLVGCVLPVLLFVARYFSVRILLVSRKVRKTNSLITGIYNESLQGVRTTKSFALEARSLQDFQVHTQKMHDLSVRNLILSALFIPLVFSICSMGVAIGLWAGGVQVLNGVMELSVLVMFIQYASNIAWPAQELANTLTQVQGAQASAERITSVLNEPVKIEDSENVTQKLRAFEVISNNDRAIDGGDEMIETIEFRNVSFEYLPGQPVLRGVNLTVKKGQTVALVGATGGGKSTIVSLVCRFYEPTGGEILINGVEYRQRSLKWLQSQLGIVLQQPHLFSGTIRENLRYGKLTATDAEVEAAAEMANASTLATELPGGYDAKVGEGGNQLSTGQKQLVSLARAILSDPQIFVMDEATSSVDTQTEKDIQDAVDRALSGRISFVIAHRLSTIKRADLICVIDAGHILEQGTHRELLAKRGRYYELYTQQFTHEAEQAILHAS